MSFFKPEDFECLRNLSGTDAVHIAARRANNKLECGAKVVYCSDPEDKKTYGALYGEDRNKYSTHKALLVNVEPVQEPCIHPLDKIICSLAFYGFAYECECGVRVVPKEFEEKK